MIVLVAAAARRRMRPVKRACGSCVRAIALGCVSEAATTTCVRHRLSSLVNGVRACVPSR